jgi:starch phosphorylase
MLSLSQGVKPMFFSKEEFKKTFLKRVEMASGRSLSESSERDQYQALGSMVREFVSNDWISTNELHLAVKQKQVYYLSIEYLLGKLLRQNLINLGIGKLFRKAFRRLELI